MIGQTILETSFREDSRTMTRTNRRALGGWGPMLLAPALLLTTACSLDEILEVDTPGRVRDSALEDPELAQTLANSVVGDVECSWNQYAAGASIHSDEWMPASGNLTMREWGSRKIFDNHSAHQGLCGDWGFPMYTPLNTARFQADDIFKRLGQFDAAAVPNQTELQATVRTWGAFPMVALGEGFCSVVFSEDEDGDGVTDFGPELTPAEAMARAEAKFTEALSLATPGSDTESMAYVGRARVRLNQGDYAGAIADAEMVPAGFMAVATRDGSQNSRWNYQFERINDPSPDFNNHGSITPSFRDLTVNGAGEHTQADGTADPRVNVTTLDRLSADFATIHYFHDKANSRADPVPVASYKEAQLFIAEASAQLNDLPTAVDIINDLHTAAGLPTWGGSADQATVLAHVQDERKRELFVEGGHRLNDMLRFGIPFLGEPGSDHPNGLDQTGAEYGDVTCFELPLVETLNNPNIGG